MREASCWSIALSVIVLGAAGLGACTGSRADGGGSDACGPARRQQAQSGSLVHVLPGQPEPTYLSDPPTSGPHLGVPAGTTVYDEPLDKAVQVGILERGDVLVQYRPADVDAAGVGALEGLAGPGGTAIVAPNPALPEPIVASAWLYLRSCQRVDVGSLRAFIEERAGKGPGGGH